MNKKTLIIIIIIIAVILITAGIIFQWNKAKDKGKLIDNATKGVLPSINTNPLENKPDINPADKANPFTNIKTNPF